MAHSAEPGQGPDPMEVGLPMQDPPTDPTGLQFRGAFSSFPANPPVSRETMPNTPNSGTRAGGKESMASEQSSQSHLPSAWPEAAEPSPSWSNDSLGTGPRLPLPQDEQQSGNGSSWQTSPGGGQRASTPQADIPGGGRSQNTPPQSDGRPQSPQADSWAQTSAPQNDGWAQATTPQVSSWPDAFSPRNDGWAQAS
ncbi:hypothetical protein, partial [Streptosporangium sp. NPDC049304]|uniref:hypothetical protein n=1 Tax=Streptosporangium sp. NPDC049304 TaxID=3154830 RepID=UPI0034246CD4